MRAFSRITGGVGAAMLVGGALAIASPAQATSRQRVITVPCSATALAAAITAANANTVVLRLAARCVYSVATPATMATGLPTITGSVTLVGGPGTIIRRDPAAAAFRILDVAAGATLRIAGIGIENGSTAALGGAIQNVGTLVLARVTLTGNTAANGGGLLNAVGATATISRSRISGNSTSSVGGGAFLNFGTVTVFASILSANTAPINGGAVNTQAGGITRLIQTTVDHNTSGSLGGGLSNLGTTTLERTLVTNNRGSGGGGIGTANTNVTLVGSLVRNNIPDNCSPINTIPGCAG